MYAAVVMLCFRSAVLVAGLALASSCSVPRAGIGGDGSTACMRNSDCEDGLRCTADRCRAGTCVTEIRDDLCVDAPGGLCRPSDPDADLNGCVYRACDESTCMETQRDTTMCQVGRCEGDLCVGTSTCAPGEVCCGDGTCMACDDDNPCTEDTCEAGACVHTPREGVLCNDGDPCTVNDICNADGRCGGTGCSELGATLRCSPGRGCVGCLSDADCPDSQTDWSPCEYGAANTPATCSGTQSRTVTTGTCSMDMCAFTETTETRDCARRRNSDVACGGDTLTPWGLCDYADTCDEDATQTRTRTRYRCDQATCRPRPMMESQACSRDTDGDSCGENMYGAWSSCTYATECAESGSRTRSVTEQICTGGSCGTRPAGTETDTTGCARNVDGRSCGAGTDCGSWSDCGYADLCDETGSRTRTCTDHTCGGGSCNAGTPYMMTDPCMRDTDGNSCGTVGDWGDCGANGTAGDAACTGMQSRDVPQCSSGTCTTASESRACSISSGTSCGPVTTSGWSTCMQSDATSCTGTRTRTVTTPLCDGSGTCQNMISTETDSSCNVPVGTTCGTPTNRPVGPCMQMGQSCVGTQETEDVAYECDGSGNCLEITSMGPMQSCNVASGVSCIDMGSSGSCDGAGSCDT